MAIPRKAETMIMREFRDIDGYEGLYKVSNYGEVYSVRKGKNLSAGKSSSGYLTVGLCKNGNGRRKTSGGLHWKYAEKVAK